MREKSETIPKSYPSHPIHHQPSNATEMARQRVPFVPSIQEHRERVAKIQSSLTPANVPYVDIIVPLSTENVKMPVRIYLPKQNITTPLPTLFYFPGTGFIANERSCTHVICSHLCEKAQCMVIEVRNRLAPENPFPIGLQDAYEVFAYFATQWHSYYHIDPDKIAIAGYSSGGNFAALIAIQAMQDNIFIRRHILISPIVDLSRSLRPFFFENEEKDTVISENFVNWVLDLYIPENVNRKNPSISPFWQSKKTLQKLPPTDILVGEWDRTRGDAELYHQKLKEAGVPTEKFLALSQGHAALWNNFAITQKIAERLHVAFKDEEIRCLPYQHTLCFIEQTKNAQETDKFSEENHAQAKAKL